MKPEWHLKITVPPVYRMESASAPITEAILRMLDQPTDTRPFVVVEDAAELIDPMPSGGFFVQFATVETPHCKTGLLFDVPAMRLTYVAFESASGCRTVNEVVDSGVAMAIALLREHRVEQVRIIERADAPGPA